jgi:regulatory protein
MINPEVIKRISKYCAEAEKCTFDVIEKLKDWAVDSNDFDTILKKLRDENFLDDTRYANKFVAEKWTLDRWGRIKIENALLQKNMDENIIREAISEIDDKKYLEGLHDLLRTKYRDVKSGATDADIKRVVMFALSRGFEEELVTNWIEKEIKNRET